MLVNRTRVSQILINRIQALKKAGRFYQLTIELSLMIALKVLILWGVWWLFFSHPIAKTAMPAIVTQRILNQPNL